MIAAINSPVVTQGTSARGARVGQSRGRRVPVRVRGVPALLANLDEPLLTNACKYVAEIARDARLEGGGR